MGKLPSTINVSELFQVGIVIRNLDASMKLYGSLLGIDDWKVVEIDSKNVPLTYRGNPSEHSFKAAFTMLGQLMIELLEPLEGRGSYREFLEENGEGIHHLGHARVDDLDAAVQALEKEGFPCVEGGCAPGHRWAYVDTTPALGYILELSSGSDPRDAMKDM
jgi:hypothetical protein